MFGLFNTKEVEVFAKSLAADLAQRFPPGETSMEKKNARQKLGRALDDLYGRAAAFHQQHRLGIYKKAKLGNTLRWELESLGYDEPFIENLVNGLVMHLSHTKRS